MNSEAQQSLDRGLKLLLQKFYERLFIRNWVLSFDGKMAGAEVFLADQITCDLKIQMYYLPEV